MRLFFAILLPEEIRLQLQMVCDALRLYGRGSWTRPEDLHMTLAFLGEQPDAEPAIRALNRLQSEALQLQLAGLGSFDDTLWAGLAPSAPLQGLQKSLTDELAREGIVLQKRAFVPHITLCRRFHPAKTRQNVSIPEQAFAVHSVCLMQSEQVSGRHRYRLVWEQPLESGKELRYE